MNLWNSYNTWNFIINCLVAVGTIGAVMIALWQTIKKYRINIVSSCMWGNIYGYINNPNLNNSDTYLMVDIINKSNRPISIDYACSFYFAEKKNGGGKSVAFINQIEPLQHTIINPFGRQTILLQTKEGFKKNMLETNEIDKNKMKLFYKCSTGEVFEIKGFRKNCINQI